MKTLTRKFMISILTLVFAVVALGSTTFAWFAVSGKAETSTISAMVATPQGLELRIQGSTTWLSSNVTFDALASGSRADRKLMPITLTGALNAFTPANELTSFKRSKIATVDSVKKLADDTATVADFVKFTLEFRTTSVGKLTIDNGSSFSGTEKSWTVDKPFTTATNIENVADETLKVKAASAARLLCVAKGTAATYTNSIFENGAVAGTVKSGSNPAVEGNTAGQQTWADSKGAIKYFKDKTGLTEAPSATMPSYTAGILDETLADGATTRLVYQVVEDDRVGSSEYYQFEVTFYMFIEGWDAECYNALFATDLDLKLTFDFR